MIADTSLSTEKMVSSVFVKKATIMLQAEPEVSTAYNYELMNFLNPVNGQFYYNLIT